MPDVRTERDGRGRVTQPRGPSLGFEKLTSSQPKTSTLGHRVVEPDRLNPNTDVIRLFSQRVRARETRRTRGSQKSFYNHVFSGFELSWWRSHTSQPGAAEVNLRRESGWSRGRAFMLSQAGERHG